jgi:nucleoside diphosphate kinase
VLELYYKYSFEQKYLSLKAMSPKPGEFIFIMLKPTAANDLELSNFIIQELTHYGYIKHNKKSVLMTKKKILEHYKASKSSLWYPIITNYFTNKLMQCFILEYEYDTSIDKYQYSFGEFLKKQVIGPSDICKTRKHHIRRLALRKPTFLLDNLVHSSDNSREALEEIRLWYEDEPQVIAEYEVKALALNVFTAP